MFFETEKYACNSACQVSPQGAETDKSLLTLATHSFPFCHLASSSCEFESTPLWNSNLLQERLLCVYKPKRLICWSCPFSHDFSQLVKVAESSKDQVILLGKLHSLQAEGTPVGTGVRRSSRMVTSRSVRRVTVTCRVLPAPSRVISVEQRRRRHVPSERPTAGGPVLAG